jgi:hypothetical protein
MDRKSPFYKGFFIGYKYQVNNQFLYQGFTLIDITPTGVTNHTLNNELARNQQRNWETVQQIISLRTQPTIISTNSFEDDVKRYNFGINYKSKQKIWSFKFSVEYADIYQVGNDRFGLAKYDFNITPVILGLTETATPERALFYPKGPWNNIYFKTLVDTINIS